MKVSISFAYFARWCFCLIYSLNLAREIGARPAKIDPLAHARRWTAVFISLDFIPFESTTDLGVLSISGASILYWQSFCMVGDHAFPSCVFRTFNFLSIEKKKKRARLVRG